MAEYIEREALINQIRLTVNRSSVGETSFNDISAKTICSLILEAPAADVVEVVRCKDCRHRKEELNINDELELMCGFNYGLRVRGTVSPDDFCSFGKRKEGAEG